MQNVVEMGQRVAAWEFSVVAGDKEGGHKTKERKIVTSIRAVKGENTRSNKASQIRVHGENPGAGKRTTTTAQHQLTSKRNWEQSSISLISTLLIRHSNL